MKEAGDGLHAQMNSMMGALQELKLLQVQTALGQLDISGRSVQRAALPPAEDTCPGPIPSPNATIGFGHDETLRPPLVRTSSRGGHQSSLGTSPSSSSLETVETESPSLDSDYSQDSMDDSRDWTSSLMSHSRNRQPLVLGDNVFADLVGNWLDLPELEKEEMIGWTDRPDSPAHPLCLSRSQEICRKVSLTTNIFKKFLRSVRPDRDKLLKERPGWMVPESQEAELFKRPKKVSKQQTKGSFYLPFWAGVGQQDRRQGARMEKMLPLFDYNTAVWV
ncbi:unnamed protein product [Oncorhynchus mykiss]|uniref:PAK4-inhibitor INKA2 n=1 Tax=Oncorhynchus mykiss TaxID=8022 RepID=A0A060YTQ5_ONCMY|nr:unnamed protein product [Oncorhynchus mykiss]